ncbi:MAG: hypothetical protein ACREBS_00970 [Nitrososphaerales archaeon]
MKKWRVVVGFFVLALLILLFPSPLVQFFPSSGGASGPVGACLPYGALFISNANYLANLQCTHVGTMTLNGTGSITLVNSTLIEQAGAGLGNGLILAGFSQITLLNSTLNLNGTGVLSLSANSTAKFSESELVNGNLLLANNAVFSSNHSSYLSMLHFATSNLASFVANSTTINLLSGGNATVSGSVFSLDDSSLSIQNSRSVLLNAAVDDILGSSIVDSNVSRLGIGNFSQSTTILSSTITSSNVENFSLGDTANFTSTSMLTILDSKILNSNVSFMSIGASGSSSITTLNSSSVNCAELIGSSVVKLFGGKSIIISNSTLLNQAISETNERAATFVSGGNVTVSKSNMASSDAAAFGYPSVLSNSMLSLTSSSNLNISNSQIASGITRVFGTFGSSELQLNSLGNTSITNTLIQSEAANNATLSLYARNPISLLHAISVADSTLETATSPGNITIGSNYAVTLNNTRILSNSSTFTLNTYSLFSYNSNIPSALTVGGSSIGVAVLYNTTITTPVTIQKGGIFYSHGWLFARVLSSSIAGSNGTTIPVPNSEVNIINPVGGSVVSTSFTNSTGWTKIPILLGVANSTMTASMTYYVVQASSGGYKSNQEYVVANNTVYTQLYLGPVPSVSNYTRAKLGYFTYALQYGIGQPTSYLGIYTNSYPVQFVNNATWSEVDFQTVGTGGYDFVFTIIYPKNFTTTSLTVKIDGIPIRNVQTLSNSTYNFESFSTTASLHKIALVYIEPNGRYVYQQNPNFDPGIAIILIVVLLGAVGTAFVLSYTWRQQRKSTGFGHHG